jgi:hypothetical protein
VGAQEGQRGGKQMVVGDRLVDVPKCALHPTEPLHNYFLFVNRMIKNLFIFRLSLGSTCKSINIIF